MSKGERTQERPECRRRHHLERQDPLGGAGPQALGVIDVRASGQDRGHQGEHLAPRTRPADSADQSHRRIDQLFQPESDHQRRRQDQPGICHQARVIEGHLEAVRTRDTEVTESASLGLDEAATRHRNFPSPGGTFPRSTFADARLSSSVDRGLVASEAVAMSSVATIPSWVLQAVVAYHRAALERIANEALPNVKVLRHGHIVEEVPAAGCASKKSASQPAIANSC